MPQRCPAQSDWHAWASRVARLWARRHRGRWPADRHSARLCARKVAQPGRRRRPAAWWRFRPEGKTVPAGLLSPSPAWDRELAAGVPERVAHGVAVHRVPAGLALHLPGASADQIAVARAVWPDPERMTIVAGGTGAKDDVLPARKVLIPKPGSRERRPLAIARLRRHGIRPRRGGRQAQAAAGWDALTPTEAKIASLIADGRSNPEIAADLFLSRNPVQTHVSHILAKLGAHSRAEIIRRAFQHTPAHAPPADSPAGRRG